MTMRDIGNIRYHPTIQEVDRDLRDVTESTLERYARDLDMAQIRAHRWEVLPDDQRRAMRAENELARRKNEARRQAAAAEYQRQIDARDQARVDAAIADYRGRMRLAFRGTDAQFEAAWPRILEDWQIEAARQALDANEQRIRARISGSF
ncbi:MAG TPA: hypothetical protein VGJ87_03220 [Roseiflexaceae bacterium]|jgi:TRAP-type C4-dicarboxylate transport system substrate-binding protein